MKTDRFFHDQKGELVLMQWPNIWIIIWAAAALLRLFALPSGVLAAVRVVGTASIMIWAVLEVLQGVNYFRRILGGVVLALTLASIISIHF